MLTRAERYRSCAGPYFYLHGGLLYLIRQPVPSLQKHVHTGLIPGWIFDPQPALHFLAGRAVRGNDSAGVDGLTGLTVVDGAGEEEDSTLHHRILLIVGRL